MTERGLPEQRNKFSGTPESEAERLRADSAENVDQVVFDEAFVLAAPVQEPSAHARLLEAHWARQTAPPSLWRSQSPYEYWSWSVRPARHLAAMRLSGLLWACGTVAGTAVLIGLLLKH